MIQLPSRQNKEWRELVTGQLDLELTNFFLNMKIKQIRNQIEEGALFTNNAVDEIYEVCLELTKTMDISKDLESIFGEKAMKLQEKREATIDLTAIKIEVKEPIPEDINTRINRINEEAALKRDAFKKKSLPKKEKKDILIVNSHRIKEEKEQNIKNETNNEIDTISKTKDSLNAKSKDIKSKNDILKKASIDRRNKKMKEERDYIKIKDENSLGSFIKSLFN